DKLAQQRSIGRTPVYRDAGFVQNVGERAAADWIRGLRPLFDDTPDDVEEKRCPAIQFAFRGTVVAMTSEEWNALDRALTHETREDFVYLPIGGARLGVERAMNRRDTRARNVWELRDRGWYRLVERRPARGGPEETPRGTRVAVITPQKSP